MAKDQVPRAFLKYFFISLLVHALPFVCLSHFFEKRPKETYFSVKLMGEGKTLTHVKDPKKMVRDKFAEKASSALTELNGELLAQKATYEMLLAAQIEKHRYYPPIALRLHREGVPIVKLSLGKKGELLDISLEKSSGEKILDEAALDIIARAQPFPPLPEEYSRYLEQQGKDRFVFYAPIGFKLKNTY